MDESRKEDGKAKARWGVCGHSSVPLSTLGTGLSGVVVGGRLRSEGSTGGRARDGAASVGDASLEVGVPALLLVTVSTI